MMVKTEIKPKHFLTITVTNMVKDEFTNIELHIGGSLNLKVIQDTPSSRKMELSG